VEIHFQTSEHVTASEKALNGSVNDLNTVRVGSFRPYTLRRKLTSLKLFRWVVRNDGDPFTSKDWQRLTNIGTPSTRYDVIYNEYSCPRSGRESRRTEDWRFWCWYVLPCLQLGMRK